MLVVSDTLHNMPVQQMGNYQEYLKKMPAPLRELESQPTRLHTFGNPFKVNKVRVPYLLLIPILVFENYF